MAEKDVHISKVIGIISEKVRVSKRMMKKLNVPSMKLVRQHKRLILVKAPQLVEAKNCSKPHNFSMKLLRQHKRVILVKELLYSKIKGPKG